MCPYMLVKENNIPYCEPKDNLCTMCVAGNMKTYNEIENNIKSNKTRNRNNSEFVK